jgi:hypothetical protein
MRGAPAAACVRSVDETGANDHAAVASIASWATRSLPAWARVAPFSAIRPCSLSSPMARRRRNGVDAQRGSCTIRHSADASGQSRVPRTLTFEIRPGSAGADPRSGVKTVSTSRTARRQRAGVGESPIGTSSASHSLPVRSARGREPPRRGSQSGDQRPPDPVAPVTAFTSPCQRGRGR